MTKMPLLEIPEALNEQAYRSIRNAITSGTLKLGERLTERKLAADLGVSPTPVREALLCLEQEGLIERRGPRSVYVSKITSDGLPELIYIQALLRGAACRLAAKKITKENLNKLFSLLEKAKKSIENQKPETAFEYNIEFHEIINQSCENPILSNFIITTDAFDRSHRITILKEELSSMKYEYFLESYQEHLAIAEALSNRDGETAEMIMRKHTLRVGERYTIK
jgi:DNA-binding GntR family transcriptional regulator